MWVVKSKKNFLFGANLRGKRVPTHVVKNSFFLFLPLLALKRLYHWTYFLICPKALNQVEVTILLGVDSPFFSTIVLFDKPDPFFPGVLGAVF